MGQGLKQVISERTDTKLKRREVIRKIWGDMMFKESDEKMKVEQIPHVMK